MSNNHVTNPELKQRFKEHLASLQQSGIQPFCELPSPSGRCPFSGLKRGYLLTLPGQSGGLVQVIRISQSGARRGKLVLNLPTLLAYLRAVADVQRDELQSGGVH